MIDQEILNISRKDRDSETIKHHHLSLIVFLYGDIVDKNQFIKVLHDTLIKLLGADYPFDVIVEDQENPSR